MLLPAGERARSVTSATNVKRHTKAYYAQIRTRRKNFDKFIIIDELKIVKIFRGSEKLSYGKLTIERDNERRDISRKLCLL